MEKQGKFDEDVLRIYLNPQRIEKAPEDFTASTMKMVEAESKSLRAFTKQIFRINIPVISAAIVLILIVIATLIPEKTSVFDTISSNFKFEIFKLELPDSMNFSLPSWIPWLIAVVFVLFLFDKILIRFFHGKEIDFPLEINS